MFPHTIPSKLLQRQVKVTVVGAGGSGSQMLTGLAQLHHAMLSLGHPGGLDVTAVDGDVVSASNVGRQLFYICDIGRNKAEVLINRINVTMGTHWQAIDSMLTENQSIQSDIVIGCVDSRKARQIIKKAGSIYGGGYWLDLGNRQHDGQVILGEFESPRWSQDQGRVRLPHVGDLFPETCDPAMDGEDSGPSCSLAEALEKQSLFINRGVSLYALNLLFELFRYGGLSHHGVFVNLKTGRTNPLAVDPEAWKRFGYELPKPPEPQKKRASRAKKPKA